MRKSTGVVLGAAAVGLGVAAAGRLRSGRGASGPELATFGNGMAYARFGVGAKTLLWIQDPGHAGHAGPYLRMMATVVRPLVDAGYTVFLVGHKPHLRQGCTLADLGDDYAELIVEEFDGRVDVVVGDTGGGMIGLTLAAGIQTVSGTSRSSLPAESSAKRCGWRPWSPPACSRRDVVRRPPG